MEFFKWLFESPTPIITIVSVILAFVTYNYQRKKSKKKFVLEITDMYSKEFIPRIRYIKTILKSINAFNYTTEFSNPKNFTNKELTSFLEKKDFTIEKFKGLFNNINLECLEKAFISSGCSPYIYECHKVFIELNKNSTNVDYSSCIYKFILDFINDLEALAAKLYYNVADEKVVYPIFHQTFLSNIPVWYFFIADSNQKDQDRFYPNIIHLYKKWNKRKEHQEQKIENMIHRAEKKNRL